LEDWVLDDQRLTKALCQDKGPYGTLLIKNQKSKIKNLLVLSMLCIFGITSASGQSNVLEDFENYIVPAQGYLDPTTVPGSGWTREGAGAADWEVHCCSPGDFAFPNRENDTFDTNSTQFLVLRRANPNPPGGTPPRSDENTDFTFPVLVEGTLRFQLNPAATSSDPFKLALRDSGSGKNVMQMVYTEDRWPMINSGDFRVQDSVGNLLISDVQLDGQPDSYDRWYDIIFTMHKGGVFDLEIIDIGPTEPSSITSNQVARGVLASVSNITAGVLGIDTFRLEPGTGGGGGEFPTMVDNLTITRVEGATVAGTETGTGLELPYSTQSLSIYQPQVTEDLTTGIWTAHGPPVLGDGATKSALVPTSGADFRAYRFLVF